MNISQFLVTLSKGRNYLVDCSCWFRFLYIQDHKATDDAEISRIEAANGFVLRRRVMGVLAVARSFGDYALKKYVPAEPFTSTTKLGEKVSFLLF